jgi:hypothetical protein
VVSAVSLGFNPLRLASTWNMGMLTPALEGWVTETDALPLTPPSAAVTLVEPAATPVANPELSMVATEVFAAAQTAVVVTLPVEPSL